MNTRCSQPVKAKKLQESGCGVILGATENRGPVAEMPLFSYSVLLGSSPLLCLCPKSTARAGVSRVLCTPRRHWTVHALAHPSYCNPFNGPSSKAGEWRCPLCRNRGKGAKHNTTDTENNKHDTQHTNITNTADTKHNPRQHTK